MDFASISLKELATGLKNEEIDLFSYIENTCNLIDSTEKNVQALLPEKNRLQLLYKEGKKLKNQFPQKNERPPLFGVLFGVKDIINAEGFPTRAGSKLPPHLFEGSEAGVVKKIKDFGGIVLGKTVTTEFAFLDPGPTKNPLNLEHTPGGSSSGSAAAVAAGYCPLSIGTQTIGSVIRPASFCGIIGYKPGQGLISNEGVIPLAKSIDQVGFFTRKIEDMEFVLNSIVDENGKMESKLNEKLQVGVQYGEYLQQANGEIIEDFKQTVELLKKKVPVKIVDILEDIEEMNENLFDLIAAEKALAHKKWFSKYRELYSEKISESIEKGLKIGSKRVEEARKYRLRVREELEKRMREENISVIISPATAEYPPQTLKSTGNPIMNAPWTFAGFPVLSIPVKKDGRTFPLGVQIAGPPMSDGILFRVAEIISEALS